MAAYYTGREKKGEFDVGDDLEVVCFLCAKERLVFLRSYSGCSILYCLHLFYLDLVGRDVLAVLTENLIAISIQPAGREDDILPKQRVQLHELGILCADNGTCL